MDLSDRGRGMTMVGAILVAALLILPAQLVPPNFFQDDSYFYLQVASNIVAGHGSTFHTITPTNGYHPLWMAFCVLAMAVAGGDKVVGLQIIVGLQALLALGAVAYLRKLASLGSLSFWRPGAALLAAFLLTTAVYGSEAHLNALLIASGTYYAAVAVLRGAPRYEILAGIMLGLAVLARLDNIFFVGWAVLLIPWAAERRDPRATVMRSIRLGLPALLVVTPYLAYNLVQFGHMMPISGAVKGTFPRVSWDMGSLGRVGTVAAWGGLGSVLLSLFPGRRLVRLLLATLGAGVVTHALYVVLFTEHYTFWPWYYVAGVVNLAVLGAAVLDRVERATSEARWTPTARAAAGLATALLVLASSSYGWLKAYPSLGAGSIRPGLTLNQYRWPNELGRWMDRSLPAEAGVLAYDYPGSLAFFSTLRILPVDGLINDFAYDDQIVRQGIAGYMCTHDIEYYFGPMLREARRFGPSQELMLRPLGGGLQEVRVSAPLSKRPAGSIVIDDDDLVVEAKAVVGDPARTPRLAVWRVDACGPDATPAS